jgi:A/G-specific adenine glycosylase
LHRAAGVIVADHGGRFPRDAETIRSLPGIGRYTAGAIASIAWDAREPILEANTVRLFCRLLAYGEDPSLSVSQRVLWNFSADLLPRHNTGEFNQALMELGSEICTPRTPACDRCPARQLCPTRARGLQDQIPRPKRKTNYEDVREAALVIRRGGKVLVRRCGDSERWAGLWDFPRFAVTACDDANLASELATKATETTGLAVRIGIKLAEIKHAVTRYRITLICYEARSARGRLRSHDLRWVTSDDLHDYPLSVTGRRISRIL